MEAEDSLTQSPLRYAAALLLTMETYHAVSHFFVLFRLRMLPKRDLVRVRIYFLVDLVSVLLSALYTRQLLWLAALQNLQHAFFYLTWNKGSYCIRVIDWSSLEWTIQKSSENNSDASVKKVNNPDRFDVTLGTAFDLLVHIVYSYCLAQYLSPVLIAVSLAVTLVMMRLVLFNKQFSWASPNSVPRWVAKRLGDLGQGNSAKMGKTA